jgi:hypothetical protein
LNPERPENPTGPSPRSAAEFESYLDGTLPGGERAAFEGRLASDEGLRAQADLQHAIDASIIRLFAHDEGVSLPVSSARVPASDGRRLILGRPGARQGLLAIAAVIALCAAVAWYAGLLDRRGFLGGGTLSGLITADELYSREKSAGFVPDWKCENDAQFAAVTNDRFGQPLLVKPAPQIEIAGWTYRGPVLSDNTAVLLTKVEGKDVLVAVDDKKNDRRVRVERDAGLHVFTKRIGKLVLYEITPRDEPAVLPLFYVP